MGDLGILSWMMIVPPVPNVCERTTRGHHPIQGKTCLKHLSKTRKHNSKGSNMRYHLLTPKGRRYTTLSKLAYLERSWWQTNFFVFYLIAKRRYENQRNPQSWHHSHRECIAWWLSINCINPIQSYECVDAKKQILNWRCIWRFPKILLTHPFINWFSIINHLAIGYPHDYGNPPCHMCTAIDSRGPPVSCSPRTLWCRLTSHGLKEKKRRLYHGIRQRYWIDR